MQSGCGLPAGIAGGEQFERAAAVGFGEAAGDWLRSKYGDGLGSVVGSLAKMLEKMLFFNGGKPSIKRSAYTRFDAMLAGRELPPSKRVGSFSMRAKPKKQQRRGRGPSKSTLCAIRRLTKGVAEGLKLAGSDRQIVGVEHDHATGKSMVHIGKAMPASSNNDLDNWMAKHASKTERPTSDSPTVRGGRIGMRGAAVRCSKANRARPNSSRATTPQSRPRP